MPSKPKTQHPRIYVDRWALGSEMKSISDDQKATLAANTVRSWQDCYELYPTDDVKVALKAAGVEWRDTKNEPKAKPLPKEETQPA